MKPFVDVFLTGKQYSAFTKQLLEPIHKQYGLTRIDIEILFYLSGADENSNRFRDIVATQSFNKGHVSQSVTRLEKMGYISKRLDENDSRVRHIDLLPASQDVIAAVQRAYDRITRTIYQNISEEEVELFRSVVQKITTNISSMDHDSISRD